LIKQIIKRVLHSTGFDIVRHNPHQPVNLNADTMETAIKRSAKRFPNITTVIDIGASNGSWSLECLKYFPDASYFLVEAQKAHELEMIKNIEGRKNFKYVIAAAGDTEGEVFFDATALWGGVASRTRLDVEKCISVPATTIDIEVRKNNLKGPFLLKLDTHGYEVPIINGAKSTLENTAVVIIEVYNFKLTDIGLRFHEMCIFMEQHSFRCIDIIDILRRPKDDALWQMDFIFIRKDSKEFESNSYE
jgi:FkbM family methyltransferase